jgi:hypothetical protein
MYPTTKLSHGVRKSTLLLTLVLMFNCCAAWATHPVVIGFDMSAPPFFNMRDGKPEGIYPAIVEAIFKGAGIPIVMTGARFTDVLANVDSGRWGVGGILKTSERVRKYDYTSKPTPPPRPVFAGCSSGIWMPCWRWRRSAPT